MRTSDRTKASICLFFGAIVMSVAGTNCLASDACLRFSDCANGLTCYNSICVIAPPQGGDEGGSDEAGADTDSSTTFTDSGTPVVDSSVVDSSSDDSGDASDDDAADASDD